VSEPTRPAHDRHDLELVARLAADDLGSGEEVAARDLLATCEACAALAADLRAIATATRELGSAVVRAASAASAVAPRDFRLSAADAARLRRRGFLGRVAVSTRPAGWTRGVGGALTTLGLVGLLVSAGLPALSGGTASAPIREERASGGADSASPVPAMWPPATDFHAFTASSEPASTNDASGDGTSPPLTPWRVATIVSLVALVTGLALLLIGRTRHRTGL
jgi:hypothetical protein